MNILDGTILKQTIKSFDSNDLRFHKLILDDNGRGGGGGPQRGQNLIP